MYINIAICDDDLILCQSIKSLIQKYAETDPSLTTNISIFSDGRSFLSSAQNKMYHLVFLDIEFHDDMNGIEIAGSLRRMPDYLNCEIVFISAYPEYCPQMLEYNAMNFLLKCEGKSPDIPKILDMYKALHQSGPALYFRKGDVCIPYRDIRYFECQKHMVLIHTSNAEIYTVNIRTSFSEFCKPLLSMGFLRVHTSYIVNPVHISVITKKEVILKEIPDADNQNFLSTIPVSRTYKKQV